MSDVASSLSPGAPAAGTTYVADGGQVQYAEMYKNARAAYVDAVWSVINWTEAEVRYTGTRHDVLDGLLAYVQVDESS
ncbi:Chromosome transmission fidelity protein 18 [Verticillium dahliae VDG1]|nr:Chromosome transmission fidelity protein 18 [Verticillium dahliae VDG1]